MNEPFRLMGLTVDEIAIGFFCMFCFIVLQSIVLKLFFGVTGTLGVYLLKKFKKLATGFSLMSFLHWKFGIRSNLPKTWPESWKRYWLP